MCAGHAPCYNSCPVLRDQYTSYKGPFMRRRCGWLLTLSNYEEAQIKIPLQINGSVLPFLTKFCRLSHLSLS